MSSLPKAAKAVAISFPKLHRPPTYHSFLNTIASMKQNFRGFSVVDKAVIDAEYERQLREQFPHDESRIRRMARSKDNRERFDRKQRHIASALGDNTTMKPPAHLDLPHICATHQAKRGEQAERQTYADFAAKAEKKNPEFQFTKRNMDEAFTAVANSTKHKVRKVSSTEFERMMSRCLGRESDKYWQDR